MPVIPCLMNAQMTPGASITHDKAASPSTGARLFPSLFLTNALSVFRTQEAAKPYWVPEQSEVQAGDFSLLLNNDIIAYYGHPNSRLMGILGRYPIEEVDRQLAVYAKQYRDVNGGRGVLTAFYLIYGTVWPAGEIGRMGDENVMRYINYALEHNMLVFLDHQIGKYTPLEAIRFLLPWLRYPNVHLALDPEWRTTRPMKEIGSVRAEEINQVQQEMENYLIKNNLPGERLLVIHQFKPVMIQNRERIRSNFERVRLVHCADGWGTADQKLGTYRENANAANIPVKSFKIFLPSNTTSNVDKPVFDPKRVMELNPRPYFIMYQ